MNEMGTNYICILIGLLWLSLAVALPKQQPPPQPSSLAEPHTSASSSAETDIPDYVETEEVGEDAILGDESDEMYASEFPYGQPMEKYKLEERVGRTSARKGRAHVRFVHKFIGKPRNYAKKYRTWMPSKEWLKPLKIRNGPKRLGPHHGGKPGRRRQSGPPTRYRKTKPHRGNHLQRPKPPPEPEDDYFIEEEYFPEETKMSEYASGERRHPHKHRRKPGSSSKGTRTRQPEDEHSVSYSNFVQHPSQGFDYADFIEDEPVHKPHKERKRKRRRKKGDKKRVRDWDEDQFGANSESIEDSLNGYEKYPPYSDEKSLRRPLRHPKPTQPTPIYGEGYLGNQGNQNRLPQNVNINRQTVDQIGLGNYRNDHRLNTAQTFVNQVNEPNNYRNFGVSNNNPQPDIITQQNYNQFGNIGQSPQFDNQYQPTSTSQQSVNNFNRPVNYNQNFPIRPAPPQQITNAHTLQNIIPTNRGNEYSSKYKSNSFFDNTDTFHNYNQNVNFNQNNVGTKHRPSFIPSTEYQEADVENEFINRHLDLYSNGMTGVPVQGDGRQESRAKDFDIGYGEIQYDESHRT